MSANSGGTEKWGYVASKGVHMGNGEVEKLVDAGGRPGVTEGSAVTGDFGEKGPEQTEVEFMRRRRTACFRGNNVAKKNNRETEGYAARGVNDLLEQDTQKFG